MRLAIDAAPANQPHRTGPASYSHHLIRAMAELPNSGAEVTLLTDRPLSELPSNLPANWHAKVLGWVGRGWTGVRLPLHLAAASYDVFWQPAYSLEFVPSRTRGIMTVHDVAFLEAPEVYGKAGALRQKLFLAWGRLFADRVITVSEHTKNQLIERAGFKPEQITVTPLAADDGMQPQPLESVHAAMEKYGVRSPYIITASRIEKKKGIAEIVEALAQLPQDVQLVLCGPDGFGADEVHRKVAELKLEGRVKFLGWVPHEDLARLLCGATCYVSACRYEGFGIAVLDALACGCPVVGYKAGAVPETVGDAAVLVDPVGPENLVAGIRQLLDHPDEYHRLAKLGVERARQFSWERTAERTLSSLTNW